MMKRFFDELMEQDYTQLWKRYAALAAGVLVACAAVCLFLLRTQIGEAFAFLEQSSYPLAMRLDGLEDAWEWSLAGFSGGVLSAASVGARTALLVSGLLAGCLFAGYWLLVAAALSQTAQRSEMSGPLWLLLGLAGNLAAVVLFFAVRSRQRRRCHECGAWNDSASTYCRHCGAVLGHSCPICGAPLNEGDAFCGTCGAAMPQAQEEQA